MGYVLRIVIEFLFIALIFTWFFIAIVLYVKKKSKKSYQRIEKVFAEIVGLHLYGTGTKNKSVKGIKRTFLAVGVHQGNPVNVQTVIDLMIRTQRMILGKNHEKLKLLYPQLPPYNTSIKKVRSRYWYNKARGIREIYEMSQSQYLQEILPYRNHKNLYVRREAQIALVVFLGWKSLRFLPYVKKNFTLWQQIKIVEKLHDLYPKIEVHFLRKAYDVDTNHGKELLMRIIRKFQIYEEVDYIVFQLAAEDSDVRLAALDCLSSFSLNLSQLHTLKSLFWNLKNSEQQELAVKLINEAEPETDVSFYIQLLKHPNDSIKLNSAEILWNNGYKEEVEQFYYSQYQTVAD
ncbi:MAG TPA: hypothetical protein VFM70_06940 [Salinimicrobium sp.]|nr:hypothetical protein [Salinimicrobium sp.]